MNNEGNLYIKKIKKAEFKIFAMWRYFQSVILVDDKEEKIPR